MAGDVKVHAQYQQGKQCKSSVFIKDNSSSFHPIFQYSLIAADTWPGHESGPNLHQACNNIKAPAKLEEKKIILSILMARFSVI
jgi:hypothetical protein